MRISSILCAHVMRIERSICVFEYCLKSTNEKTNYRGCLYRDCVLGIDQLVLSRHYRLCYRQIPRQSSKLRQDPFLFLSPHHEEIDPINRVRKMRYLIGLSIIYSLKKFMISVGNQLRPIAKKKSRGDITDVFCERQYCSRWNSITCILGRIA